MDTNARPDLTDNQRRVLRSLTGYWKERGIPPTLRELAGRMGFESNNAVRGHLEALKRKGYVTWNPKTARSLRILHTPPATEPEPEPEAVA